MQSLRIPVNLQETVDIGSLTIRSKPFQDKDVSSSFIFFHITLHISIHQDLRTSHVYTYFFSPPYVYLFAFTFHVYVRISLGQDLLPMCMYTYLFVRIYFPCVYIFTSHACVSHVHISSLGFTYFNLFPMFTYISSLGFTSHVLSLFHHKSSNELHG